MTKIIAHRAPGPGLSSVASETGQPGRLLLADGVTVLALHGQKVWQGRSWELVDMLLGIVDPVWIAMPTAGASHSGSL